MLGYNVWCFKSFSGTVLELFIMFTLYFECNFLRFWTIMELCRTAPYPYVFKSMPFHFTHLKTLETSQKHLKINSCGFFPSWDVMFCVQRYQRKAHSLRIEICWYSSTAASSKFSLILLIMCQSFWFVFK